MRQRHKRKDGTAYYSERGEEYGTWEWLIAEEQARLEKNLADLDKFKDASDDTVVYEAGLLSSKRTKKDMMEVIESRKRIVYDRSTDAWHKDYVKMIRLTPEGIAKAEELLNVKKENVSNVNNNEPGTAQSKA